jgi:hypothetical protein
MVAVGIRVAHGRLGGDVERATHRAGGRPLDPDSRVDQDDLATVRNYEQLSPSAGLWALHRRVTDFADALARHPDRSWAFEHPDFGSWTIGEMVKWLAHEINHHHHDISRGMAR